MEESSFSLRSGRVLNEGFPDLGLLEDENFDDGSVGAEKLVEVVMSNDIAELVIDADEQDRPLASVVLLSPHHYLIIFHYISNYNNNMDQGEEDVWDHHQR